MVRVFLHDSVCRVLPELNRARSLPRAAPLPNPLPADAGRGRNHRFLPHVLVAGRIAVRTVTDACHACRRIDRRRALRLTHSRTGWPMTGVFSPFTRWRMP